MMKFLLLLISIFLLAFTVQGTETRIIVRAKSKDAKFIGSSIGGAYVVIRDKVTQRILAEGLTTGTPGNTDQIMKDGRRRYDPLADEAAAKFTASIDIDQPLLVRVEVLAPYHHRQSQVQATTELWLIPGKHLEGDGIVLEIPGFIIDILSPRTHHFITLDSIAGKPFLVQANIVMMCGCIITKGGVWNADEMEVKAIIRKNGVLEKEATMQLTQPNLFEANIDIRSKGNYEITVYAFNKKSNNTGVDKVNFVVY